MSSLNDAVVTFSASPLITDFPAPAPAAAGLPKGKFMKLRTALLALSATALLTGVAIARTPVTVKLEAPVAEATRVVANGAVWQCEGDTCTGVMTRAVNARTCGELAEKVGRIAAFAGDGRTVVGEELTRCNSKAPQTYTAAR
jgi:hypothetical protein